MDVACCLVITKGYLFKLQSIKFKCNSNEFIDLISSNFRLHINIEIEIEINTDVIWDKSQNIEK
jgi:hypothetical protein